MSYDGITMWYEYQGKHGEITTDGKRFYAHHRWNGSPEFLGQFDTVRLAMEALEKRTRKWKRDGMKEKE